MDCQNVREKHSPPLPIQPWTIRTVCCIHCHAPATLKPTKSFTNTVLRCDNCKLLYLQMVICPNENCANCRIFPRYPTTIIIIKITIPDTNYCNSRIKLST